MPAIDYSQGNKFPETDILLQNVYLLIAMNSGLALGCEVQSFVAHKSTLHDLTKDSFTVDLIMV